MEATKSNISKVFTYITFQDVIGWDVYNPLEEFKRMGIPNEKWKIVNWNEQYQLTPTYPAILCVPRYLFPFCQIHFFSPIRLDDIKEICEFRSRGRFPVLS